MASARQPRLEKQFKAQSTESSEGTLFNWSCLLSPKNWIGCLTVREVQYSRMILKYILSLNFFPRALFEFRLLKYMNTLKILFIRFTIGTKNSLKV